MACYQCTARRKEIELLRKRNRMLAEGVVENARLNSRLQELNDSVSEIIKRNKELEYLTKHFKV